MAGNGSALVVIDMQRDFCEASSALCVRGAAGCLPQVQAAVAAARAAGVPVLWVVREHDASGTRCLCRRRVSALRALPAATRN
jgi:nicotinamidase-related amidase